VPRGGDQSEAICTMRPRAVALITAALFPIYCSSLHGDTEATIKSERDRPTFKQRLVEEGVAHAALVFDGDDAIAWCEYGSPAELPGIYHRNKQYDAGRGQSGTLADHLFLRRSHQRRSGVAREALDGALELIALAGGRRGGLLHQRARARQEDLILVPAQRHQSHVREGRMHVRAASRPAKDCDAQDDPGRAEVED
jgi:hypothetical protein